MITVGGVEQIDPEDAFQRMRDGTVLVDVREAGERRQGHVPDSIWIPLAEIPGRHDELPEELIVMCAAGMRSQQAAQYLNAHGHRAANMMQGIHGWARSGLPLERGDG